MRNSGSSKGGSSKTHPYGVITSLQEEDLFNLKEFSRRTEVPEYQIRNDIRAGKLYPAMRGGGRGREHLFSKKQIELYRKGYGKESYITRSGMVDPEAATAFTGSEAQQCFRLFREGKSDIDIVEALGLHPYCVSAIRDSWLRASEQIVVHKTTLDAIAHLELDGPIPIRSEADLYQVLEIASASKRCSNCKRNEKAICIACFNRHKAKPRAPEPEPEIVLGDLDLPAPLTLEEANGLAGNIGSVGGFGVAPESDSEASNDESPTVTIEGEGGAILAPNGVLVQRRKNKPGAGRPPNPKPDLRIPIRG